jgi:type II secretory pathway pseudopilin PulG
VELTVVLAILGLLLALVLPAVQSARESARRMSCANNVKQIGLAIQNFEATHRAFPRSYCGLVYYPQAHWCLSPAGQLAGYLDEGAKAMAIGNVTQSLQDTDWDGLPVDAPAVLHCPSDSVARGRACSYRFCRGVVPLWPQDPGGVFYSYEQMRPSDVTDGLSNTAFVSERLIGTAANDNRFRDPLLTPSKSLNLLAMNCVAANQGGPTLPPALPYSYSPMGSRWLSGEWMHASYDHLFPPNSAWRDCLGIGSSGSALMSARSNHIRGVHVGFGDGRCVFVSDYVDLPIWRAWATRSGDDAVAMSQ